MRYERRRLGKKQLKEFRAKAYKYVYGLGGRLSGEHGIGLKRLKYMEEYTDPAELDLMKTIKTRCRPEMDPQPGESHRRKLNKFKL